MNNIQELREYISNESAKLSSEIVDIMYIQYCDDLCKRIADVIKRNNPS